MKTFIKIKRGIISPKHYESIGPAIWLFMYIIDHADFDTGVMYGYNDADAAEEIGAKKRTVRSWRDKLSEGGYITWKKKPYSLNVTVSNWDNPQDNWGVSDIVMADRIESDIESDIEPTRSDVTHHPITRLQTPDSINNYANAEMQKLFVTITGMLTFPSKSQAQDIKRLRAIAKAHNGDAVRYCSRFFQEWMRRGYAKSNTSWLDWAVADDIPKRRVNQKTTSAEKDEVTRRFLEADV